jgi:hypothetical protein
VDVPEVFIELVLPCEFAVADFAVEGCGQAVHAQDVPLHIAFPSEDFLTGRYFTGCSTRRTFS